MKASTRRKRQDSDVTKVAIYARVSTGKQTVENQLDQLRKVAKRHDWEIVGEYLDQGISGANGRDRRPEFDRLCRDMTAREFDMIAAWSLDRIGRSVRHLAEFVDEAHAKGVDLYLEKERIDTSTPAGKLMFNLFSSIAEFERERIRERIHAGLDRARKKGKQLGRKPSLTPKQKRTIKDMRAEGQSLRNIAKALGTSLATVQRVLAE